MGLNSRDEVGTWRTASYSGTGTEVAAGLDVPAEEIATDPHAQDTNERAYEVEVYRADDGSIIDMWGGALCPDEIVAEPRTYAALIRQPTALVNSE
jgi:hypothetical protein